ncbi:trifunctional transcriptional regulator/proline dehydrogenase/L-glutamate gamma-semialdehyde dehydrogenase [Niveibacterium sp. SC-1]|uniref:trifunctional transcriptional regulator/proline dehydrogenase/L-glutamate gamma-semialdehyde dehydrogenase n=1 Tax=Niveibacterium sp. SC-1 TaxID=3135646 RepID=UPI00311DF202
MIPPFNAFSELLAETGPQTPPRAAITADCRRPESELIPTLLEAARLSPEQALAARMLARRLATGVRERVGGSGREGLVQALLQEFSLSSQEGVALMCLAEALLRIPDSATRDALIRDKLAGGDWERHLGHSASLFVNAATWGLLVTGRLAGTHSEHGLRAALGRVVARGGEPVIRLAMDRALRLLGEQFVAGETIQSALARAQQREARGFRHSYDMLGEAARTDEDAQRYFLAYESAIHAIGAAAGGRGVIAGPGISIKLSALHPRYVRAQRVRVMGELYPRLRALAALAAGYDIGLNIDAEESERLDLSLDLLEALCMDAGLAGWNGIGFVVQAYQKRCPAVLAHLVALARQSGHRLMLRLVKGAYWDTEIKAAQVLGLAGYPVYTRKAYTDLAYLACARSLLAAPDAVFPQFATHNAHTLAAVLQMAGPDFSTERYEFQCLHGMGEPLYEQVVGTAESGGLARPCRIYAPVGRHETLLAYLVRRLLENGANTSFVHRVADPAVSIDELVTDPVAQVEAWAEAEGRVGAPHPSVPLPPDLFGKPRRNASGLDLADEQVLAELASALTVQAHSDWRAAPLLASAVSATDWRPLTDPADARDIVGQVQDALEDDVSRAIASAEAALPGWLARGAEARAAILLRAAEGLETARVGLISLLVREAGKTLSNAVGELREAVDFLRYYAQRLHSDPSERGGLEIHRPLGVVACISPWNFPLAIFVGQVAGALAAGNTVLAKPAEQTPLTAAEATRILLLAGVPADVLQLLPGAGETVGAQLVADPRVRGVVFTGSVAVARRLQQVLAQRAAEQGPVALIAETGGINTMIVDSSALPEQVVADVLTSAFDSAGQRCSALRILCLQEEIADAVLQMLRGAMAELTVGDPARLATDVGPLIDAEARARIDAHLQAMAARGHRIFQATRMDAGEAARGHFLAPTLIEIAAIDEVEEEVFGPVLHVLRFPRTGLSALVDAINARGYGLTLGLHTRIDESVETLAARAKVGNLYVNRSMIGAVVGVQPFGGEGLSGTGPKAGGPLYLDALRVPAPLALFAAVADLAPEEDVAAEETDPALAALQVWARRSMQEELAQTCARLAGQRPRRLAWRLPGPTGERDIYRLLPRREVLCLAGTESDVLTALAAVLAAGGHARLQRGAETAALEAALPTTVLARVVWTDAATAALPPPDAVICLGPPERIAQVCRQVAEWPGAIVPVIGLPAGTQELPLLRLMQERVISINTSAAGGNTTLMGMQSE